MYTLKTEDGTLIYSPFLDELAMADVKASLELNKTGTLHFRVPPTHPFYETIKKIQTDIYLYEDDVLLWKFRVLNEELDFANFKNITCEGELSYLLDSIQRPFEYQGRIKDLLKQFLDVHNSQVEQRKQFKLGNVTVVDTNDYINRSDGHITNTLEAVNEKLIKTHGGYIRVRHEADGNYLDYVDDYGSINHQEIRFGTNLLDITRFIKGENIRTAIIPLGAETDAEGINGVKKRLDITSVNGEKDYVFDQAAVNLFGWIWGTVEFDDVTIPANLKSKGTAYLNEGINFQMQLELTAFDLHALDVDVKGIRLGDWVRVVSEPHNLDRLFLVSKLEINLANPGQSKIYLGGVAEVFTANAVKAQREISETVKKVASYTLEEMNTKVENATELLTGAEGGYLVIARDKNGKPYELLAMDHPTLDDAVNLIRINQNGIGFSTTGKNGPYLNAWTIDGTLIGSWIGAGTIKAEALSVEYRAQVNSDITAARKGAEQYTDESLAPYPTTVQVTNMLTVSEAGILASAESKATSVATTKANAAEANAKADTVAKLTNYYDKGQVDVKTNQVLISAESRAETIATTKANTAEANAKADTANKLASYYNKAQVDTKVNDKGSQVLISAEAKATEIATDKANTAETNAKADTANKLKEYYNRAQVDTKVNDKGSQVLISAESRATEIATAKANTAEANAKADVVTKLIEYYNKAQIDTKVSESGSQVLISAETKASQLANSAEANAKADAASKLASYYNKAAIDVMSSVLEASIQLRVTGSQAASLIDQKADAIRLKANKIAWSSTNSSMTEDGKLTCKEANIQGSMSVEVTKNKTPFTVFAANKNGVGIGGDYLHYYTDNVENPFGVGGFNIIERNTPQYGWYYYWESESDRANGLASGGPWVVWGGWNLKDPNNPANYKFVVFADGRCKAVSWITGSRAEDKKNIVEFADSALDEVRKTKVYEYDLKSNDEHHTGFVIGDGYDISERVLDGEGTGVEMYNSLAIAYKAIQELEERVIALEEKKSWFEKVKEGVKKWLTLTKN